MIQFKKVEREIASSWKIEDLGIFRLFDKYVWPRMVSKARRVDALVRFNGDSIARIKGGKRGKRSDWQVVG